MRDRSCTPVIQTANPIVLPGTTIKVALGRQINNIFHKNLSLGDTSTKFGINDVHDLYFKKSMLPSKISKMIAIFQDS